MNTIDEYAKTVIEERQSKWDPLMETHNPDRFGVPDDVEPGYFGVASDAIHSFKWVNGTLDVKFRNGGAYRYHDVPENVYDVVRSSPSVGRAFHRLITCSSYKFEKL